VTDARAAYTRGRDARAAEIAQLDARANAIGVVRLALAACALGILVGVVWLGLPRAAWAGVPACVVAFAALVVLHARVHAAKDRATAALRFHTRGLDRLDGRWTHFAEAGERFGHEDHLYADDLDIFGRASLFQLLDATETRFGEERLAGWLAGRDRPAFPDGLRARQQAVKELAGRIEFREQLSALGALLGTEKPDVSPFVAWAEQAPKPFGGVTTLVARALPAGTVALMIASGALDVPNAYWLALLVVSVALQLALRAKTQGVVEVASSRERGLARYADMIAHAQGTSFDAPLLDALAGRLRAGVLATRAMAQLSRIVAFLDARQNEVFRFVIGPVLMWDLNCAIALDRWRARAGKHVREWFDALGEMEALASLAGFAFDRLEGTEGHRAPRTPAEPDDHAWPELAEVPTFEAVGLGHPLIAQSKRVANDVALGRPGHALVVTGSNMSGKSTLLRAIGINAVLAASGAPVCAERMTIGPVEVVTSMRVRDSLEEGVSRFYAELKKLKVVVDHARAPGVLFLLDEILHGTNSRERLIGARAIVRELLARGAMGAVSTHDLAIADLERELAGRVKNVHFEEQVDGDTMTFDYKLRAGVVHSSNALRLMKMVGLDVVSLE
jgi:hypothetical protein